ncbi:MAG TPA: hypothetical protein VHV82_19035 [Sporichthyaceae bacterium]|nr:hypothetical protein [Sporichthyaceae bacterium]
MRPPEHSPDKREDLLDDIEVATGVETDDEHKDDEPHPAPPE